MSAVINQGTVSLSEKKDRLKIPLDFFLLRNITHAAIDDANAKVVSVRRNAAQTSLLYFQFASSPSVRT